MCHVVDSSGWLEYFTGGTNAGVFQEATTATAGLIVPTVVVYEVYKFVNRTRDKAAALRSIALMSLGKIVDLDSDTAIEAANLSAQHRLPMADSIILATARRFGATLWTQDVDFAGMDGVRYIAKS